MYNQLSKIAKAFFSEDAQALPPRPQRLPSSSRKSQNAPQRTVLVVDRSGTMGNDDFPPSRLAAAQASAIEFAKERAARSSKDEIAVVSYEAIARRECSLQSVKQLKAITRAINGILVGGYTAIGEGLREAEKIFARTYSSGLLSRAWNWMNEEQPSTNPNEFLKRVVLLTDGHQCHGCEPLPVAKRLKRDGVQIDCIGVGGHPSTLR